MHFLWRGSLVAIVAFLATIVPTPAWTQSFDVSVEVTRGASVPPDLAFTGAPLLLLAVAGGLLVLAGLVAIASSKGPVVRVRGGRWQ